MAGGIFISYRREDARHAAGRLVDRLGRTFKPDQLFLDVDNIEPGLDFVKVLSEQVQKCDVLLAVIGPGWLDAKDERGARRLDNPRDFVRIEIEAALTRDIRVVPVLVDGARMPGEDDLPPSLQPLARRNAVRLAHERFASDSEDLTKALERAFLKNQNQPTKANLDISTPRSKTATTNFDPDLLKKVILFFGFSISPYLLWLLTSAIFQVPPLASFPPMLIIFVFGTSIVFVNYIKQRTDLSIIEVCGLWLGWVSLAVFVPNFINNNIGSQPLNNMLWVYKSVVLIITGVLTWLWWRRRRA